MAKSIGLYISFLSYVWPKKATQLAYRFFSEPREGRLHPDDLPEILKKANRETLAVNNEYFEVYHWSGTKEPLLLIHGWESNSSRWEPLLPYLQQKGKLAYDINLEVYLTPNNGELVVQFDLNPENAEKKKSTYLLNDFSIISKITNNENNLDIEVIATSLN